MELVTPGEAKVSAIPNQAVEETYAPWRSKTASSAAGGSSDDTWLALLWVSTVSLVRGQSIVVDDSGFFKEELALVNGMNFFAVI